MKITVTQLVHDHKDTYLSRLFFILATEHTKDARDWEKVFGIVSNKPEQEIELKVTFNGVEVPFESFVKRLEEQHDEWLEDKAKSLLDKKLCEVSDSMDNLKYLIDEVVAHAKNKVRQT